MQHVRRNSWNTSSGLVLPSENPAEVFLRLLCIVNRRAGQTAPRPASCAHLWSGLTRGNTNIPWSGKHCHRLMCSHKGLKYNWWLYGDQTSGWPLLKGNLLPASTVLQAAPTCSKWGLSGFVLPQNKMLNRHSCSLDFVAEHSVPLGTQNGAEADEASAQHFRRQQWVLEKFLGMVLKINPGADMTVHEPLTIPVPYTAPGIWEHHEPSTFALWSASGQKWGQCFIPAFFRTVSSFSFFPIFFFLNVQLP